jgi:hypothetical protein
MKPEIVGPTFKEFTKLYNKNLRNRQVKSVEVGSVIASWLGHCPKEIIP